MKARNIKAETIDRVVRAVSDELYDGNITFKRAPEKYGRAIRFTLTVLDSSAIGSRRSNTGRRICAACWHAHRDIMRTLFAIVPNMGIQSASADYWGRVDFEDKFARTGCINIGSEAVPIEYQDACNCND